MLNSYVYGNISLKILIVNIIIFITQQKSYLFIHIAVRAMLNKTFYNHSCYATQHVYQSSAKSIKTYPNCDGKWFWLIGVCWLLVNMFVMMRLICVLTFIKIRPYMQLSKLNPTCWINYPTPREATRWLWLFFRQLKTAHATSAECKTCYCCY